MSSSIVEGILSSLSEHYFHFTPPNPDPDHIERPSAILPTSLIACVHKQDSADALKKRFEKSSVVQVLANENVRGVKEGAIIILGVEPDQYQNVLSQEGMREALTSKILVSLIGGVTIPKLETAIYGANALQDEGSEKQCQIIRVTPSTASAVRDSYSLIVEEGENHYPPSTLNPVYSLFLRVGTVKMWPEASIGAAATLAASSGAFFALAIEGVIKGAIELGIDRNEATEMAVAAMRGTAQLITHGDEPKDVRRKIATPGGSTEAGLKILEEKCDLVNVMAEAVKKTTTRLGGLGDKESA